VTAASDDRGEVLRDERRAGAGDDRADVARADPARRCGYNAEHLIPEGARRDARYCSKRCRQLAHRMVHAVRPGPALGADRPMRFAYADPPYPGKARYYPERTEVDHAELIARLSREVPDGWALSTSAEALPHVLSLCPIDVRVLSWVRAVRRVRSSRALHAWEPVIVRGGRALSTDAVQRLDDVLSDDVVCEVLIYRGRFRGFPGAIVGMKPPHFCEWVFRNLGARRGDELADLFPGSGAVGEAWRLYTSAPATCDASSPPADDPSRRAPPGERDASPTAAPEASRVDDGDPSRGSVRRIANPFPVERMRPRRVCGCFARGPHADGCPLFGSEARRS
jgi:hypothetical protein